MRAAHVVFFLVLATACGSACTAGTAEARDGEGQRSPHDYTLRLRPAVWGVSFDGAYDTRTDIGKRVSVSIDGDLGYDEIYPTFAGEASLRWGRHDFSIVGVHIDESERAPIKVTFTIGDKEFASGGSVDTVMQFTDVNFRYSYSFFDLEEDGFRLGPTIGISYTKVSVEFTEIVAGPIATGVDLEYDETIAMPSVGFYGEVPLGHFLLSAAFGGFYGKTGDFEAMGFRAGGGLTWRPFRNIGLFTGMNAIFADVTLSDENVDNLVFWGPAVGLELRY
jgi:hypothetical protein